MKSRSWISQSEEETIAIGEQIGGQLPAKSVVLLIGNLGAGKTTLAKGIVKGMGAAELDEVSSPTFPLIHEYGTGAYHIDLYRLDRPDEVLRLGLNEIFERQAVVLVEWGERFSQLMPRERIEIHLLTLNENVREISIREGRSCEPDL